MQKGPLDPKIRKRNITMGIILAIIIIFIMIFVGQSIYQSDFNTKDLDHYKKSSETGD